jgi:tetratricopeptide (TPR) repeat protein
MRWRRPVLVTCLLLLLSGGCSNPAASPHGPADSLAEAWQEAQYLNFPGARRLFERVREQARAGSDVWVESTLGLAISFHHAQPDTRGDKQRAAELYDDLIAGVTNPVVLPQVLLLRARLADQLDYAGDERDLTTAQTLYRRLMTDFPNTRQAGEAVLYLGHLAADSGEPSLAREAIRQTRSWIHDHPDDSLASLHWDLIARLCMYPLDQPAEAVTAFLESEKAGLPPMTARDAFYWRVANLAERAGDAATAVHYFERIILEEPRSGYGFESQLRLQALGRTPPPLADPFAVLPEHPSEVIP